MVNALIKGIIVGLSNDESCAELELIFEIISRLLVEECDRSKNVMAALTLQSTRSGLVPLFIAF